MGWIADLFNRKPEPPPNPFANLSDKAWDALLYAKSHHLVYGVTSSRHLNQILRDGAPSIPAELIGDRLVRLIVPWKAQPSYHELPSAPMPGDTIWVRHSFNIDITGE